MADTVVVTGVSSFLGFHLARAFCAASWRVVGSYFTPPHEAAPLRRTRWEHLRPVLSAARQLDITDAEAVRAFIRAERPAVWVHQAGIGHNFCSDSYDLAEASRVNLIPLKAIYAGMSEVGGMVILTGSGMEYGLARVPYAEDMACWPQSPYGVSRLSATLYAGQLAHLLGVPTRVARIFTVFGEFDAEDRLVSRLLARLASGQTMEIAPGVARDICDVRDIAEGFKRLAEDCAHGPVFDVFNLSRGIATPLADIAHRAAELIGCAPGLIRTSSLAARRSEPLEMYGDSGKALARLGWKAKSADAGLARLIGQRAENTEAVK